MDKPMPGRNDISSLRSFTPHSPDGWGQPSLPAVVPVSAVPGHPLGIKQPIAMQGIALGIRLLHLRSSVSSALVRALARYFSDFSLAIGADFRDPYPVTAKHEPTYPVNANKFLPRPSLFSQAVESGEFSCGASGPEESGHPALTFDQDMERVP